MSLVLGHRGLSSQHLENSMEAFRAALAAGMDGFELDAQPTADGVCVVMHDEDFRRTCRGAGSVRSARAGSMPLLKNGESIPRLVDALELPARLVNVELKGEPGWQQALAAVEAADALDRVLFSSFEPSEVLQLWNACPRVRCGFLWDRAEALDLTPEELADLPAALWLHPPLKAVMARPAQWAPYASRLAVWGMTSAAEAKALPFEPAVVIADGW
ncbi:MAG: hypothetical protein HY823_13765 [Acidobacteria bacterium]|nr:hypothetical protein [Acidobacteriota bacterium]